MLTRLSRLAAVVLALALLLAPAQAATLAEALPQSLFTTNWYSILIQNQRSGHSSVTLQRLPDGVESLERSVLRVQMGGRTLTTVRTERRRYDADLRLLEVEHHANQMGRVMVVKAAREGDRLQVLRQTPEGDQRYELALPQGEDGELHLLLALARGEVAPDWRHEHQTFDADLGKIETVELEVKEPIQEPREGWLLQGQSALLGITSRTWIARDGTLLRQEIPGMLNLTQVRVTEQEALAETTPLELHTEIRVNTRMPGAVTLRRVLLKASLLAGEVSEVVPVTPRQRVELQDAAALVETEAEHPPELTVKLPVRDPALKPYLVPTETAQSADPAIIKRSREILGGETDAWQAARKLLAWVHQTLGKMDSEPRPLSALEVLTAGSGDCTEHAILLAALAQAAGLPARLAVGLVYDQQAYHYHAWTEVWVGRWVEMDPTWGQETVDAGHLQLGAAELDSASLARLSLISGKTMGNLQLEVLEYR